MSQDADRSLPGLLRPLLSNVLAHRNAAARAAVDRLTYGMVAPALDILSVERSPEVVKWLGMAIAHVGSMEAVSGLKRKLQTVADQNAHDWLVASLAVLQPVDSTGRAKLLS